MQSEDSAQADRQTPAASAVCPVCAIDLPPGAPPDLCPRCLLGAGVRGTGNAVPEICQLGHYQLIRRLGGGGMGEVHEADDEETGRRVALKLLSHRLDSPEARRRFLREGRLAASVNHPNSVFVFSTGEFDGIPVISMELMPGGTLEDKVRADGPLAVADAVDAILQVIDGLEAAHNGGILHRDIKPSNCFIDSDGTVKIGDYGLSISTNGNERETFTGREGFVGTPAYCPPEHVRGDDLTVRSDIYSVGVTLFYLLTGRPPFIEGDQVRLFAQVLEAPAPVLEEILPGIPRTLASAVRRCMAKRPEDRFANYGGLRAALAKFGTRCKRPAEPWQRMTAGTFDLAIVGIPGLVALRLLGASIPPGLAEIFLHMSILSATVLAAIAGFTLFEWKRGATPGKALLGLEVSVAGDTDRPWLQPLRLLGRACAFVVLPLLIALAIHPPVHTENMPPQEFTVRMFDREFQGTQHPVRHRSNLGLPTFALWIGGACLLFLGAERHNGWLAIHDRIAGARVLRNARPQVRQPAHSPAPQPSADDPGMLGTFHILEPIDATGEWFTGFDPVLLRKVWLRKLPHGADPVPSEKRALRRTGRLRWLAGARGDEGENWDAYEHPGGHALIDPSHTQAPWNQLRQWMADVAHELVAAQDEQAPAPCLDRIWINADGRAKLLDFPAPGLATKPSGQDDPPFWLGFAALLADDTPPAIPVREFLAKLPVIQEPADIARELDILADVPDAVTRGRRLAIVVGGALGPLLVGLFLSAWTGLSPAASLLWALAALVFLVALPAMFAAAFTGGGPILRLVGASVVDSDGIPADNSRAARRSLIAWSPVLVSPAIFALLLIAMEPAPAAIVTLATLATLACLSALVPGRSLQDRLAGTWLVSR